LNHESPINDLGGHQNRGLVLNCQDLLHDIGLVVRHRAPFAHAQNPQEVKEIRILLLHEPRKKVVEVLRRHFVNDLGVVVEKVLQHSSCVHIVANLRLEEGDVSGEVKGILFRSPIKVL